jgi:hypothetical protein
MTARTDAIGEARSDAEDAYDKVRPENQSVVLDGMTFGDHERIDSHFDDAGMPDENIRAGIKQLLAFRKRPLSPAEHQPRKATRKAAHDELDRILAAEADTDDRTGNCQAEER